LTRDRHRCIITRCFDRREANARNVRDQDAKDDDGEPLIPPWAYLEVAHIIPHSLVALDKQAMKLVNEARICYRRNNSNMSQTGSQQYTLRILDMFDPGVVRLVEGYDIDRAYNAITLTREFHGRFGDLEVHLEHIPHSDPHIYVVRETNPSRFPDQLLPVTRTLFTAQTIDPPSQRLLSLHRACAFVLHLSGAAEYVNRVLRDMDEGQVKSDGTTDIATLLKLKLDATGLSVQVY